MKLLPFVSFLLVFGIPPAPPASAGEVEIALIQQGCVTVRRLPDRHCKCFSDMAGAELDDAEQIFLAAWMANDHAEAERLLLTELTLDQARHVNRFASSQLVFCGQYS